MMTHRMCPDRVQLIDYLHGRLPDEKLSAVESHFEECNVCEETMRGLVDNDTLSDLVSQIAKSGEHTDDDSRDVVTELVQRMQGHSTPASKMLRNRSSEVTARLAMGGSRLGTLAQYDVLSILGVGSTSVVYQARDTDLDRLVALKVLRPSVGEAAQARFVAEAKAAASIEHPNVVAIYQVGEAEGLIFIAMKWVPGESLESRLSGVTYLEEAQLRAIGSKICNGLEAAHRQNLIHRDIKPANIWLTEGDDEPIILDFGLARIAHDDPDMTATGMIAGTPNFMSPEQAKGLELDARSDLFSLGCVFYRAATGKLPFSGTGILSTLQAIQNETPRPPVTVNPHLSVDLSDLTMGLLEKQPGNRPASAADIQTALTSTRKKWPFMVASAKPVKPGSKGVDDQLRNPQKTRAIIRWIMGLAACAAMAFGGYQYRHEIIRIATNQGVLEIDSRDEAVKIEVLQNGEVIRVIDTKTDQKLNIESGTYQLKLQDNRNGFELSANAVIMTRGGEAIVTVTKVVDKSSSETRESSPPTEHIYNGKTLADWKRQLQWETNEGKFGEALRAISALLREQPELRDRATFELLNSISDRKFLSHEIQLARLMTGFNREWVFEWVASAASSTSVKKRNFGTTVLRALRSDSRMDARIAVVSNSDQLVKTSFESIDWEGEPDLGEETIHFACKLFQLSANSRSGSVIEKFLLDELPRLPVRHRFTLASSLLFLDLHRERVFKAISGCFESIPDKALPNAISTVEQLRTIEDQCPPELLPKIALVLAKNPQISGDHVPRNYSGNTNLSRAAWNNVRNVENQKLLSIQVYAIELLGRYAAGSKNALPFLDEISEDEILGKFASFVAKKIRRAIEDLEGSTSKADLEPREFALNESEPKDLTANNTSSETSFAGRTYDQWLNVLRNEVDVATIEKGIEALSTLRNSATVDQKVAAIKVVRRVMAKGADGNLEEGISQQVARFVKGQPERFYDWMLAEIPEANIRSMAFLEGLLARQIASESGRSKNDVVRRGTKRNALIQAFLKTITTEKTKRNQSAARAIQSLVYDSQLAKPSTEVFRTIFDVVKEVEDEDSKLELSMALLKTDVGRAENTKFWLKNLEGAGEKPLLWVRSIATGIAPEDANDLNLVIQRVFDREFARLTKFQKRSLLEVVLNSRPNDIEMILWLKASIERMEHTGYKLHDPFNKQFGPRYKIQPWFLTNRHSKEGNGKKESEKKNNVGNSNKTDVPSAENELTDTKSTYDGRTLDQWLDILKTEVNERTIENGVKAIGILGADANQKKQDELFEIVTALARRFGSGQNGEGVTAELVHFFGQFPPEKVYDWVLAEIPDSNAKSMSQMNWYVVVGSIYERRPALNTRHAAVLKKRKVKLAFALLKSINDNDPTRDRAAIEVLNLLLIERSVDFRGIERQVALLVLSAMLAVEDERNKLSMSFLLASSDVGYRQKKELWLTMLKEKNPFLLQNLNSIVGHFQATDQPQLIEVLKACWNETDEEEAAGNNLKLLSAIVRVLPEAKHHVDWVRSKCELLGVDPKEIDRILANLNA